MPNERTAAGVRTRRLARERTAVLVKARAAVQHIGALGTRYITPGVIMDLANGFALLDSERNTNDTSR